MDDRLERNKALVREVFDRVINGHDPSLAEQYYPEDYVQHEAGIPPGRNGLVAILKALFKAVPDVRMDIKFMIAEGDRVMAFVEHSGTQVLELDGSAPVDKPFRGRSAEIFRVSGGLLVEHWGLAEDPHAAERSWS